MKTRGITEGAIFCAIAVILSLLGFYVPFFVILTFFIPVPMIVLGKRQGLKVSILSSVASTILIGLLLGPGTAFQLGMLMLLVGCGLGWSYEKNLSSFKKTMIGTVGFALFIVAVILFYQLLTGVNFINSTIEMFETASREALSIYQSMGILDGSQLQTMESVIEENLRMILMTIPSAFLLMPVIFSMANVVCSDLILKRLGYSVKGYKKLSSLILPNHLKVFLMFSLVGVFVANLILPDLIPEIYIVTVRNLVNTVFFVMGLACVFNYINFKGVSNKAIKVLVGLLCFIFQPLITFLGIADTYLDIRRIFRRETQIK
ncbi:DUF2232 domain-containing protein [Eubacteriaceae bacterium ES3]|nr:DUF2232 domain-containing protein [Eubacteriaceae bacterium ES3]